jgi:long-chain acyl-CoA synthetase
VRFNAALARGPRTPPSRRRLGPDDVAVLQYTGGTTGVSKGAVLSHRNLVANVLQSEAWFAPADEEVPPGEQVVTVCALPLYHIFGFTREHDAGAAHRRLQHPDPQPRDIRACQGAVASSASTASRRSTRCSTRWPTIPTSTAWTGSA